MQLQEQYFTLISWDVWFEIEHIFILIVIILVICLTPVLNQLFLSADFSRKLRDSVLSEWLCLWDALTVRSFSWLSGTRRAVFSSTLPYTARMWAFKLTSFAYETELENCI